MDAWLDFSANNSPLPSVPPMAKPQQPVAASSSMTSPQNTMLSLDQQDDLQTPAKPSHEYSRFKQQTKAAETAEVAVLHQSHCSWVLICKDVILANAPLFNLDRTMIA